MTRRISSSRPMTGSSLPLPGQLGQIATIALQRLIGGLGVLRGDALAAAHLLQRLHQPFARDAQLFEQSARGAAILGHRQQQVLDRDVFVLQPFGLVLSLGEQAIEAAGDVDLIRLPLKGPRPWAGDLSPVRHGASALRQATLARVRIDARQPALLL